MFRQIVLSMSMLALCTAAGANESGERRRGPPPEALEACADLQEGDDCTFIGRDETVTGYCAAPADRPLACAPEGRPPRHRPDSN